jgi:hypothetical protein
MNATSTAAILPLLVLAVVDLAAVVAWAIWVI